MALKTRITFSAKSSTISLACVLNIAHCPLNGQYLQ